MLIQIRQAKTLKKRSEMNDSTEGGLFGTFYHDSLRTQKIPKVNGSCPIYFVMTLIAKIHNLAVSAFREIAYLI